MDLTPFSNVRYLLQRLAVLGLLAFLGAHLWFAWAQPRFVQGHAETFSDLAQAMRHDLRTTVVYALGTLAIAHHLANGLWFFSVGRGIAMSRAALAWMEKLAVVMFVALLATGWGAVYALWRAGA